MNISKDEYVKGRLYQRTKYTAPPIIASSRGPSTEKTLTVVGVLSASGGREAHAGSDIMICRMSHHNKHIQVRPLCTASSRKGVPSDRVAGTNTSGRVFLRETNASRGCKKPRKK